MDQDIPNIDEPDHDDPKEPYAFFGLAAYYVQCFEQIQEVIHKLDRKTMSTLIQQASKLTKVDDNLAAHFSDLLAKRNYLMHHFREKLRQVVLG